MEGVNFLEKAKAQGVERPFRILARMDSELRGRIANNLGVRLRSKDNPEAEAWEIINRDLIGLQARTHHVLEKVSPFSRNNNWWEIVTRAASWMGVPYYPGMSERQIERLFFENIAERVVTSLKPEEIAEIDRRAMSDVELYNALTATGLSSNAIRLVFFGLSDASPAPRPILPSMSRGLSTLLNRSKIIFARWASLPIARRTFKRSQWQLASALSVLYLQSFVEESLDEFQSLRY